MILDLVLNPSFLPLSLPSIYLSIHLFNKYSLSCTSHAPQRKTSEIQPNSGGDVVWWYLWKKEVVEHISSLGKQDRWLVRAVNGVSRRAVPVYRRNWNLGWVIRKCHWEDGICFASWKLGRIYNGKVKTGLAKGGGVIVLAEVSSCV